MKKINFITNIIILLVSVQINTFAQSTRTQQQILTSILWEQLPEVNNLVREDIHFDDEYYYFNTYHNEKKRDKPNKLRYYFSNTKDTIFDASKVGQSTNGQYIIIEYILGAGVYEVVEICEDRVMLTRGKEKRKYIWTPRAQ